MTIMGPDTETLEKTKDETDKDVVEDREKTKEEEEEDALKRSKKPPKDGPCKRCGHDRPLNRLLLCYSCWTKVQLEKSGWREGQPHPKGCGCHWECRDESKSSKN